MKRFLSIAALCAVMAGCGGGSSDLAEPEEQATITPTNQSPSSSTPTGLNAGLVPPTTITLELPPFDGQLPADLYPPV